MIYKSASRTVFVVFNYTFFILFSISILVPFFNALAISFSSYVEVSKGGIGIWPRGFNLDGYLKLMANYGFLRSAANTIGLTIVNTVLVIFVSLFAAYSLANKNLIGRNFIFTYIIITMFFSGGLIPTYLLVNGIGLNNTYWALILPQICNAFYIIIFKNVINQLPQEILESAEIDGAGNMLMLFRIVLPLVMPMTMAFTIFSAVAYWNEWFGVLIYIRDQSMWTLQFQLRDILITGVLNSTSTNQALIDADQIVHPQNLKMAALMITVLPIVVVYPFVQKYFIHGQLVGAVKG